MWIPSPVWNLASAIPLVVGGNSSSISSCSSRSSISNSGSNSSCSSGTCALAFAPSETIFDVGEMHWRLPVLMLLPMLLKLVAVLRGIPLLRLTRRVAANGPMHQQLPSVTGRCRCQTAGQCVCAVCPGGEWVWPVTKCCLCAQVRNQNKATFARLKQLIMDQSRHIHFFANESHKSCYTEREPGESANDRNDRAIRNAAEWYSRHLSGPGAPKMILITHDAANKRLSEERGITAMSLKDYVHAFMGVCCATAPDEYSALRHTHDRGACCG